MVESQAIATLSGDAALPATLDLRAVGPEWSVSEYCSRHGRLLDARRFAGMFLYERSETIIDCQGARYNTELGT